MRLLQKLLSFTGLALLCLAINLTPMLLIGYQDKTSASFEWIASLVYPILVFFIFKRLWATYQKRVTLSPSKKMFGWEDFGIAFLLYAMTRVVAVLGTLLIQLTLGTPTSANDAALMATDDQARQMFVMYFVIFHLAIGLFAPIFEELVFRGFFSIYFFKGNSKWLQMIVSSSIFAVLHISSPIEFIMYFGLGVIFYLAYARRGNIKDAIVVHILNNLLLVLFSTIHYIILLLS